MIRYTLTCPADHRFDSWFKSADTFDQVAGTGHLACPDCGSADIRKALMAPGVSRGSPAPPAPPAPAGNSVAPGKQGDAAHATPTPQAPPRSEDVGDRFVQEARRIHAGEAPARTIHGRAAIADARALLAEGVPVLPLPPAPPRRSN